MSSSDTDPPDPQPEQLVSALLEEAAHLSDIIGSLQEAIPRPTDYWLSETELESPLAALAALAPTLKEAELRVLLHLAAAGKTTAYVTIEALATATRTHRSAIMRALATLDKRKIIRYDAGSRKSHGSRVDLLFLQTVSLNCGRLKRPMQSTTPVAQSDQVAKDDVAQSDQVVLGDRSSVASKTLPPATPAAPAASIKSDLDDLIDHVLNQENPTADTEQVAALAYHLRAHLVEIAGFPDPPQPDPPVLAQCFAIASYSELYRQLKDLRREQKKPMRPGYSWFVTVFLQRVHGATPARIQARRAALAESRHVVDQARAFARSGGRRL